MSTVRPATPEDLKLSQEVACDLTDTICEAPVDIQFGALSLLVAAMFSTRIEAEYRLSAFDDFTKIVRKTIEESLT